MSSRILITGAAGNLGSLLARYILANGQDKLALMYHVKPLPEDLAASKRVRAVKADLMDPASLRPALAGVATIVHFAGVLFKARPEGFLPITNTQYFRNLVDRANQAGIAKLILISFPHVEGQTYFDRPAQGRLDGTPISCHARTRLEEERYLFERVKQPVSLRVGMVYGRGILMVDAARWFARHQLLGVWREPTQIHLISREDFCAATYRAIVSPTAQGVYHLGDEGRVTLQEFLDIASTQWGTGKPWRMPLWMIYTAAGVFEMVSAILGTPAPLTRDFIDIGRVNYYGDTARMRAELLPNLTYPTLRTGKATL